MSTEPAHFSLIEGGAFMPTPFAQSHWGDDHLNGPAVVRLAARALENHCGAPDFMPTRFTADLFRAARNVPTTIDVRVVRDGRRVRSAECDVVIDFSSESIPLKGLNYELEVTTVRMSAQNSTAPALAAVPGSGRVVLR